MKKRQKKSNQPRRNLGDKPNLSEGKHNYLRLHYECMLEYGINFRDRVIVLEDDIMSPMFGLLDAAMTEMEKDSRKGITIKIKSEGGYVYEAQAIVGRIKKSGCHITTEGYGCVMSAATLILAAGDKRKLSNYGYYMHHESSYGLPDGTRHSTAKDTVARAEREEDDWCKWMAEFSNKNKEFWRKKGQRKDAFFTPEELLDMDVIDEVF